MEMERRSFDGACKDAAGGVEGMLLWGRMDGMDVCVCRGGEMRVLKGDGRKERMQEEED